MGDLIVFKPAKRALCSTPCAGGPATVVIFTGVRRELADSSECRPAKARKTRRLRDGSERYSKKCKGKTGSGQQL